MTSRSTGVNGASVSDISAHDQHGIPAVVGMALLEGAGSPEHLRPAEAQRCPCLGVLGCRAVLSVGAVEVLRFIEQLRERHQMGSERGCFGHDSTLRGLGMKGNREGCTSPGHEETPGENGLRGLLAGDHAAVW